MQNGDEQTGMADEHYNLVSVLYHSLEGADTYSLYVEDAEDAEDMELVEFFRRVQSMHTEIADEAKRILGRRLAAG